MLAKFDEDQPRDDHGRWSNAGALGAGTLTLPSPLRDDASVRDAVGAWAHTSDYIRDAAAGKVASGTASLDARAQQWAATLLDKVTYGKVAPNLYRGLGLPPAEAAAVRAWSPGDKIDLNLSSWTSMAGTARSYADERGWRAGDEEPVILHISGARGFSLGNMPVEVGEADVNEREWVTQGRFSVLGVSRDAAGRTVVDLSQDRLFVPTYVRKFDASEPRDLRGRWTSETEPPMLEDDGPLGLGSYWQEASPEERKQLAVTAWQESPADSSWIRHHPESEVAQLFRAVLEQAPEFTGPVYRGLDDRDAGGKVLSQEAERALWEGRIGQTMSMEMVSSSPVLSEAAAYGDTILAIHDATSYDIRGLSLDAEDGPNDYPENILRRGEYEVTGVRQDAVDGRPVVIVDATANWGQG